MQRLRLADGQGQAAGAVSLTKLVGKNVPRGQEGRDPRHAGGKTAPGRTVFGATGSYFEWPVQAGGLGARQTRCLNVKTSKIERCK